MAVNPYKNLTKRQKAEVEYFFGADKHKLTHLKTDHWKHNVMGGVESLGRDYDIQYEKLLKHPVGFRKDLVNNRHDSERFRIMAWLGKNVSIPTIINSSLIPLERIPTGDRIGRPLVFRLLDQNDPNPLRHPGHPDWIRLGSDTDEVVAMAQHLAQTRRYRFKKIQVRFRECEKTGKEFKANYPKAFLDDLAGELEMKVFAVRSRLIEACFELPPDCFYRVR